MNILLVYPEFLVTFWSWKHLRKFIGKKAAFPPLGLLTVAAILPESWDKKLVDLNVRDLTDEDILWADGVAISAMITQKDSAKEVITRCKKLGKPITLGGPILESGCAEFTEVDHFLMGEVENTLSEFLRDLQQHNAKRVYSAKHWPDITTSPIPSWELIDVKDYSCMLMQYSRGCPFNCEFCNIADINGHKPRPKLASQFLCELDTICLAGFRGAIMLADDNFIGNKRAVKEMLPRLIEWQKEQGYPVSFIAEADITLADDEELMSLMVSAGFKRVFLGLETPNKDSLIECGKLQNAKRDMAACVKKIQNSGMEVVSGFIVGFDADKPATFVRETIDFIQNTGIIIAMVGVLQAPPGSRLYARLRKERRLRAQSTGNNTDCYPNFVPKMPVEILAQGYKEIVKNIYSPKKYYERICVFLREYNTDKKMARKLTATELRAFLASTLFIGILGGLDTSYYYWKTLLFAFRVNRRAFPEAVASWIYGTHFYGIAKSIQKA